LKAMIADGKISFDAKRYRPVISDGDTEYDTYGEDEHFDESSLRTWMKDYMHEEPSMRYQIAKSAFERQLVDAEATKEIQYLLGNSMIKEVKDEATKLLSIENKTKEVTDRLFELYLQRDDMATFSAGFRDMEAFFGKANEEDDFDWSQFNIEVGADIDRLQKVIKEHEELGPLKMETSKSKNSSKVEKSSEKGKLILKNEKGEEEEEIQLDDPSSLKDKEGRVWAGVILNTDIVQKTMPGNRMNTSRALVCVGNMKGAAGFGKGKGKSSQDAINAAFRDALRNLYFIDLYDGAGLYHDVHGKHNSCHAYIRATPKTRLMVGSPFASSILERFGIASASVKLVGRRDPYAMCRAIFNALDKHQNIDEVAKDRGKRYLDLKFAADKGL